MNDLTTNNIYKTISELLIKARASVQKIVNTTMTYTYFEIGKLIVEEEQNGKEHYVNLRIQWRIYDQKTN